MKKFWTIASTTVLRVGYNTPLTLNGVELVGFILHHCLITYTTTTILSCTKNAVMQSEVHDNGVAHCDSMVDCMAMQCL